MAKVEASHLATQSLAVAMPVCLKATRPPFKPGLLAEVDESRQ